ncbi:NAD-dependent malic enzyme [Thiotrichales bacterium 19S9-12]|nr:NAD-dependent malic enzyme [Thiotrichales bacterium 19S9-11]MCF6810750.1 NAD-dependent malic enzyme [Thiotrichales bacterium 19S9-12]
MAKSFIFKRDLETGEMWVETNLTGKNLLTLGALNKGTAFTEKERWEFSLKGKLPYQVESIEEQKARAYQQYCGFTSHLDKHTYLKHLHDRNETLFYRLVRDHLGEMLPIIYTPVVGEAVKRYSHIYRAPRGLYIAYPDRHRIKEILRNRTNVDVDIVVASDAEGVLGIGDQGVGGIEIPVAKLMVYTLCAGLNPGRYLPVFLDAGTNNKALLEDPLYLGWRNKRVSGQAYDEMMELFVQAVKEEIPDTFLHWEDFGRNNARKNLERYQDEICSFNDDMQGTAAVAIAALLTAAKKAKIDFTDQRIVIFGSGTAGIGIADEIVKVMIRHGLSKKEAYERFWCLDQQGLITDKTDNLSFQKPYARKSSETKDFKRDEAGKISLEEVVAQVKPTTLIGCSGVAGAFSEKTIKLMAKHNDAPIIIPLSNPTERCEALPKDIIRITEGRALIATGSPFKPVGYKGTVYRVAQCNNALVFPGIGLGVVALKCKRLTSDMLWAACKALANYPIQDGALLPSLSEAYTVSRQVAFSVAHQAINENVASTDEDFDIWHLINNTTWEPKYYSYKKVSKIG